ncbi:unnamed protein product [Linum tenue]|nr:unnamed protein product [Linum tenue]
MYYLEYEPDTMAPFLRGLIRRFLASRISSPSPSPHPRTSSSYTYLQAIDSTKKSKSQDGKEVEASHKYNLESIPGL